MSTREAYQESSPQSPRHVARLALRALNGPLVYDLIHLYFPLNARFTKSPTQPPVIKSSMPAAATAPKSATRIASRRSLLPPFYGLERSPTPAQRVGLHLRLDLRPLNIGNGERLLVQERMHVFVPQEND